MFCSECGREIVDDAKVCSYCGKPVQGSGQSYNNVQSYTNQQYYNNQPDSNAQYYSNQPDNNTQYYSNQLDNNTQYYSNQFGNNTQYYNNPANNNQQHYQMQRPYGNPPYNTNNRNVTFKPDNQFNLVAGLFTWIWALCKGMWDLFLMDLLIGFICGLLMVFQIGIVLSAIYIITRIVIVGRNANYYYRLKETQKIPLYKAIQDSNLRRI